jgi:hypothetical protein
MEKEGPPAFLQPTEWMFFRTKIQVQLWIVSQSALKNYRFIKHDIFGNQRGRGICGNVPAIMRWGAKEPENSARKEEILGFPEMGLNQFSYLKLG